MIFIAGATFGWIQLTQGRDRTWNELARQFPADAESLPQNIWKPSKWPLMPGSGHVYTLKMPRAPRWISCYRWSSTR